MTTARTRPLLLTAAAMSLSLGVVLDRLEWTRTGLALLVVALALLVAATPRRAPSARGAGLRIAGWLEHRTEPALLWPIAFLLHGAALGVIVATRLDGGAETVVASMVVGIVLVGAVDLRRGGPSTRHVGHLLMLGLTAAMLVVVVTEASFIIDVRMFQEEGVTTLVAGDDPYATGPYRDIYEDERTAQFYGPGLAEDGVLQFGYPYMPLSLLLAVPFHLLTDVRHLHLAAVLVAMLAMVRIGRNRLDARRAAALLATSPMVLLVVEGGWIDLLLVALLAGLVGAWSRGNQRTADVIMGLLLATKQTAVLFVPVHLLLVASRRGNEHGDGGVLGSAVRICATAAAIALPFLLWSREDMVFSTVVLQFLQPFRPDSQSLLYVLSDNPPPWSAAIGLLLVLGVLLWVSRRVRRDAVGLSCSFAIVMLVFLLWSKQAFVNYYVVALGCILLALASTDAEEGRPTSGTVASATSGALPDAS